MKSEISLEGIQMCFDLLLLEELRKIIGKEEAKFYKIKLLYLL